MPEQARRPSGASGDEANNLDLVPPYNRNDVEHRLGVALANLRRLHPAWYAYIYGPDAPIEPGQHDVLWQLVVAFPYGCRMSELASALKIDPSSATRAVDKLVGRGLVTRTATQRDKRVLMVKATDVGVQLFQSMSFKASERWRAALHATLSPDELRQFMHWLERLLFAQEEAIARNSAELPAEPTPLNGERSGGAAPRARGRTQSGAAGANSGGTSVKAPEQTVTTKPRRTRRPQT
jgi:DNA-binding MarR family transcriptional regulator